MLKTIKDFLHLMQNQRRSLYLSLCFSFCDGVLLMVPLIIAYLMISKMPEFNLATTTRLSNETVFLYMGVMIASVLIRIVLRYFTLCFRSGAGYKAMCEERIRLGVHLKRVSLGFFTGKNLGDLVSTITSDAAFLEIEGMGVIEKAAMGFPALLIGLNFLFHVDYRIFVLTVVLLIPAWFSYRYFSTTQDRLKLNRQKLIGEVTEETVEFVRGIHVLKSCCMEAERALKIRHIFARLRDASILNELAHLSPMALFQFWFRFITAGTVLLSGVLFLRGDVNFLKLFLLVIASFSLFQGVEAMGIFSIFSKMTQQSIDRIKAIKEIPVMESISGKEQPQHFDIAYQDVTFAYDRIPVLHHLSFYVPEKTTTALVGLSGSGKTTIINLLARFWDAQQGKIQIGGKNIQTVSYEYLLRNLSFVFQDVMLFKDTVLNNILLGNPSASMEDVVEAAKRARCHEFIMQLENGYDTMLGEDGTKLSGGEKQRLSIARAIIKDAPIVLLDEVTANMDVENELMIQMALQELLQNKTVIMIAHKLSTIQNVDQILVLENGSITQRGTHRELLAQDGLYKNLWKIQYEAEHWSI